jgi:hypothetical protein
VIIFADAVNYPTAKRAVFLLKQWCKVFRPCSALMSRQKRSDLDIRAEHGTLCTTIVRSIIRESIMRRTQKKKRPLTLVVIFSPPNQIDSKKA